MRKFYSLFLSGKFLFVFLSLLFVGQVKAQTTVATEVPSGVVYVSDTDPGVIVFGVRNDNSSPITITGLGAYLEPLAGTGTYTLWYHPTAVTGAPPAITTANGWVQLTPSGTVTPTSNAVIPILSGLNLTIPANTTYRLALEGPVHSPYYGVSGSTDDLSSGGGILIYMQNNPASPTYAGTFPNSPSSFTPRSFYGTLTFVPASACTEPPVPGTPVVTAQPCVGSNITLDLSGNSIGTGQTYQWQSSPDDIVWTNVGPASSSQILNTPATGVLYYRAQVTCGATTVNSPSVLVNAGTPLNGVYSINSANPTGGTNFQSFSDAAARLSSCGITGPVTFNVQAGSGPYTEQVVINTISGASSTNTVTFNGNNETLQFAPTVSAERYFVKLDGAEYVTIKNLNITASSGSTYGWGVHLTNGADHNRIEGCTINLTAVTSTTQSNSGGVVASGSTTSVTTDGSASFNVIINNTIIGGYQGIIMNGATGSLNSVQNQVLNNTINDFYSNGMEFTDNDGTIIRSNNISRATRTGVTTFAGIELGSGNINCIVDGNRIHDTHNAATTQSGTAYGIYITGCDAPVGSENSVINNLIYNFNSTTGLIYALYNSSSNGVKYYHNTVVLDHPGSTSGTTRGFYQTTTATDIEFKNNIIYIGRAGSGVKYCVYFGTTASSIVSDNNILYNVSTSGTNGIGSYGTAGSATLVDWQGANGGAYDQASISIDPQFTNPGAGDYTPGNTLANNTGVPVGVTTDILGNSRDAITPDAGAYEFSFIVAGNNMSAESLVTPDVSATGCYTATEPVTIRVRNNGTTTIDFAVNPVTVTVNVTGAVVQVLTTTINTGTLASNATLDVVLPGVLDMSVAGLYVFDAHTTMTGDSNPADDAMVAAERTKQLVSGGGAVVSPDNICITQSTPAILSTDGTEIGYSSLQWQQSLTPGTGFTNIPGATDLTHSLGSVTETMYYRLVASCGTTDANSTEAVLTVLNPQILSTTPATRCGPGELTLGATASPGNDVNWYTDATSNSPIATGNTFITPTLTSTTTYYVAAGSGGTTQTANHGVPTVTTSTQNTGLLFDLNVDVVLNSIDVYTTTGSGDVVIALYNSSGTLMYTSPTFTVPTGSLSTPHTLTLNWPIPAGTNYRILVPSHTPVLGYHTGTFPIDLGNGVGSITSGATATGTSTLNYFIYNMTTTAGCTGVRTAVTATVNAAAPLDVAQDTVVCNNSITQLSVVTDPSNYTSYVWSPAVGLFTDAAATIPYTGGSATTLYVKTATQGEHKYYIDATNTVTNCSNIDSVTVTVLPASIDISATQDEICGGETTILSIDAGPYGSNLQWLSSTDGVTYTPISGANGYSYETAPLPDTTYFKLEIRNSAGDVCVQSLFTVNVNNPEILATAPVTTCSPGQVNLGATGSPGTTVIWYDVPTGGTSVGTGNTFTTPPIATTTTYYASASSAGGMQVTGMPAALSTAISGAGTTNYGLVFDALSPFTLQTVTIYPISSTPGLAGTVTIDVVDASNTILHSATVPVIGNPTASATAQTVTLNFDIQPGTNLKLRPGSRSSGITGLLFEPAASAPGGNYGYPYVVPGVLSINTSTLTAPPTNTPRNDLYYYFYNWVIGSGCESPRVPVTATIAAPELSVQQDTIVCNNAITMLSVTSTLSNFDSYIWTPSTGLYTDAAATIPYTGGSATTVYAKSTAEGLHKYFINANNSSTSCANIDSVSVTVLPASLTISATKTEICQSGESILSIPDGEYGSALQWYSSTDGVTYTLIPGATTNTYATPTITATTHYKVELKNSAGVVCLAPTITINVGTPLVTSTTDATRCGPGTVTLGATMDPAWATLNWYTSPVGGTPIATGTSFTTPTLTSTTTYYVGASTGGGGVVSAGLQNATSTSGYTLEAGLFFNALSDFTLEGVYVYPTGTGAGTATIALQTTGNVTLQQAVVNLTGTGSPHVKTYVPLNFSVTTGTDYRLVMLTRDGGVSGLIRESGSSWGSYPLTTPGILSITSGKCCPDATSTSYYYFYDWQVSAGCESTRLPVTATVTPAPTFNVATDTLVCSNAIVPLSVVSNVADYDSYTWTPMTGLYTDPAATIPYTGGSAPILYARMATAGVNKYYIDALNNTSGCANIDSVTVTVLANDIQLEATRAQICGSGSTTIALPDGEYGNATYQWYSSSDGVAFTPIGGATTDEYTTPVLTANTYYKVEIKVNGSTLCAEPSILIAVGIPEILTTTPATRCDPGSVTIEATAGPQGATVNWYENATGGQPIASGNTFTTPVLPVTTTYYAAASFGFATYTAGRLAPASATNLAASPRGIRFTAHQPVHLESVTVFSTTAAAGDGVIELHSNTGALLAGPVNVSWAGGGTTANPVPYVLPLNFDVPAGTEHRLLLVSRTGGGIAYETSNITGTWGNYSSPGGEIEIVSSLTSATGTSTTAYYYFYDWKISTGCESPRVPVDAIINGTIVIDAAPIDMTLCEEGQPVVFSVSATGAITDYQWRKDGIPISGATSATYTIPSVTLADAGEYDVIVNGPCATVYSDTATLVFTSPTIVTSDPIAQEACPGGTATFTSAATGAGSLGYQWRKDGVPIPGAYDATLMLTNISITDAGSYDVIVTGGCNQDTSAAAMLTVGEVTSVVDQPVAQVVCEGGDATFTVTGAGEGTLTYQWRKAGIDIAGATSATFTINGVTTGDAGNYDVIITGTCGSAISALASLTVTPGTHISTQPQSQSICIGSSVTFTVTASGSGPLTYQWRKAGIDIPGATSSSFTINGVSAGDIAAYDVVITGSCGSVTSNAADLLISAPGTWIGVQNSDWNNSANWCGAIPTATTDVLIPVTAPNMPVLSTIGHARNITIESGATVTINTGGLLNLYGNITGAGIFDPSLGTIAFRGAAPQTAPAFTAANVTMNGDGGFELSGNTTVTGTLTLTKGHITLGSNDLSLGEGSSGSTISHVITNGSGDVIALGLEASEARTIPVGISAASYTPVMLKANAGHVTDDLTVKVIEHVFQNGTTGGQISEFVVDRTWLIDELVTGGSNVDVTVQWNEGDELLNFGRLESYVMQNVAGSWVPGVETMATGANPYLQTRTNVTSFAPFAVQTDPLPVVSPIVYPNPVRDILNVIVRTNAPEQLKVAIFDMKGRMVKQQIESVGYGGTQIQINVTGLSAGGYILKISTSTDREFFVRQFIKVN